MPIRKFQMPFFECIQVIGMLFVWSVKIDYAQEGGFWFNIFSNKSVADCAWIDSCSEG